MKRSLFVIFLRVTLRNRAARAIVAGQLVAALALAAIDAFTGNPAALGPIATMGVVALWGTVTAFNAGRAEVFSNRAKTANRSRE